MEKTNNHRFYHRIKKSNGKLLRQRIYWKKECLQERKKHQAENDAARHLDRARHSYPIGYTTELRN